jgi:hypothetical protein
MSMRTTNAPDRQAHRSSVHQAISPLVKVQDTVDELGNHRWTFSQTIADVNPSDWGGILLEQH